MKAFVSGGDIFDPSDLTPYNEQQVGSVAAVIHIDMERFRKDVLEYINHIDLTKYMTIGE